MKHARFLLGQIVTTPGALKLMKERNIDGLTLVSRHVTGDWGDLNEEDKQENDLSVIRGFRILSAYRFGEDKLWIITEADRSLTTILLPEEF